MTVGLQKHVGPAPALMRLIIFFVALLGVIIIVGGIYLASAESFTPIKFAFFGNDFSSSSIGVAMVFIGAVLVVSAYRYVLRSIDRSASFGGAGGNAEVIGDGEAHGGNGGSSGSFGPGGDGGNARVVGGGKATGGAGGNGG